MPQPTQPAAAAPTADDVADLGLARAAAAGDARAFEQLVANYNDLHLREQYNRDVDNAERAADRRSQVGSGDRSERIRTYNWPENRISDHRINYKSNNLDSVLDGNMDDIITALQTHERQERLEAEQ